MRIEEPRVADPRVADPNDRGDFNHLISEKKEKLQA